MEINIFYFVLMHFYTSSQARGSVFTEAVEPFLSDHSWNPPSFLTHSNT